MSETIKITKAETNDIARRIQKFYALQTIKKILEANPERIEEFGFEMENFESLENELNIAENTCYQWWNEISKKYNLPLNVMFHVHYQESSVTIY